MPMRPAMFPVSVVAHRRKRRTTARRPAAHRPAARRPTVGGRRRRVVRRVAPMAMMGGRRRRVRRGGGPWWDAIKSGFNTAKDYVKNNQLISKGIRMIPGKYSAPAADIAERAGYGRRRRSHRTGGRVMFPAVYTTGLGGMAATI